MNKTDQILHQAIHQHMMSIPPDQIFSGRISIFDQLEKSIGVGIHGTVLDIGCGSGYASIWLAKNKPITKIYAQEASISAVKELLPRNIAYHGVAHVVEPIEGSFDAIPFEDSLDFVVSFGALHHSPCLFSTMKSIGKALKNGGYLIAQEPVMPNTTSNQDYVDKYNIIENRFGMKIRNGDRNDNFFRESEYITAASFSGLDLVLYEDFSEPRPSLMKLRYFISRQTLHRVITKVLNKFQSKKNINGGSQVIAPKYIKNVMRKIFVFRKKDTEYIPHIWRGLHISSEPYREGEAK